MNLSIDIGNTFLKIGVFEGNIIHKVYQEKSTVLDSDEFIHLLQKVNRDFLDIKSLIISSVRNENPTVLEECEKLGKLWVLSSDTKINFQNNYGTKNTLGLDRISGLAGATFLFPTSQKLIINAGTCITYDFLNRKNEYSGGIISPGLIIRSKALHTFTAKLPLINPLDRLNNFMDINFMGSNTEECIQSGIYWGIIHEIKGFIEQFQSYFEKVSIILTGGDAKILDTHLKNTIFADQIKWVPDLVLIGLNQILTIQNA